MKAATTPYVPASTEKERLLRLLHRSDAPVILTGPIGCGKTTLVQEAALELGCGLETSIASPDLRIDWLEGFSEWSASEGSRWIPSRFVRALQEGSLFLLDEANLATPEVLTAMFSVADHRRTLFLSTRQETITAHPDFRLILSYNPSPAHRLPEALRQRCRVIQLDYLPPEAEAQLIVDTTGVADDIAVWLTDIARVTRKPGTMSVPPISTRAAIMAGQAISWGEEAEQAVFDSMIAPLSDTRETLNQVLRALSAHGLYDSGRPELSSAEVLDDAMYTQDDEFFETELEDNDDDLYSSEMEDV